MHKRNDAMAGPQRRGRVGKYAEGKPIDHDRLAGGDATEAGQCCVDHLGRRARKSVAQVDHVNLAAALPQSGNHAPVILIAAGRLIEASRHRKGHRCHNAPSYHARAVGDSATVTRIAPISWPSRPSSPFFTAAASPSKTCLVRNSVVVLTDLNAGMSSRLR